MTAVRCIRCGWTGNRKTDAAPNSDLDKGCPQCASVVRVGPPPPTRVATTPSGIVVEFWDDFNIESGQPQQRRYKVNGTKTPSVTSVLRMLAKDALLDWAADLAREGEDWREVRNKAGQRGRDAHDLILRTLLGERTSLADMEDDVRGWGQAAYRWLSHRRPNVLEAECMVASVEHEFVGRFDLYAHLKGRPPLAGSRPRIDFKTVKEWHYREGKRLPPYVENVLQLDLYECAAIESGYAAADYGLVVRLGPDGAYDETPVALDVDRGLAVLAAYRARNAAHRALTAGVPVAA